MLVVDNISKRYGTVTAVDEVGFTVNPGEVVAFIGPNGAGKSSTFRVVVGLAKPDVGSVRLVERGSFRDLMKADIGFLPEERGLYQDVYVRPLLEYWGKLRGLSNAHATSAADYWLSRFDLVDKSHKKVSTLSKGNQQKLQLAACFIHDPKILVLDEPFSGLDPLNQELMSDVIREQCARGAGVLLSAHQLSLVQRIADRVIILNKGRVISDSSADDAGDVNTCIRSALVWFSGAVDPDIVTSCLPTGYAVVGPSCLRLDFSGLELTDYYARLALAASYAGVRDVEVAVNDLHQTYLTLVGGESRRIGNG